MTNDEWGTNREPSTAEKQQKKNTTGKQWVEKEMKTRKTINENIILHNDFGCWKRKHDIFFFTLLKMCTAKRKNSLCSFFFFLCFSFCHNIVISITSCNALRWAHVCIVVPKQTNKNVECDVIFWHHFGFKMTFMHLNLLFSSVWPALFFLCVLKCEILLFIVLLFIVTVHDEIVDEMKNGMDMKTCYAWSSSQLRIQ